jgi:hypothetical protein
LALCRREVELVLMIFGAEDVGKPRVPARWHWLAKIILPSCAYRLKRRRSRSSILRRLSATIVLPEFDPAKVRLRIRCLPTLFPGGSTVRYHTSGVERRELTLFPFRRISN